MRFRDTLAFGNLRRIYWRGRSPRRPNAHHPQKRRSGQKHCTKFHSRSVSAAAQTPAAF